MRSPCLTTLAGGTIVDAAHIHQFAASGNNDIQNGLALSKNAHWMFDNGLWTLTDDYRVVVATSHFVEAGPDGLFLQQHHGCPIRLPSDTTKRPGTEFLAWHRSNRFADGRGELPNEEV
jgi:putative restriction endonuclease